ncbi:MAG: histidinol-phosphate transaminase, partial [Candidatus Omnitrophica bacterium]|nr:histidinol-phosphate transaminase [Candidatus Omnitrophota bacterium]
MKRLCKQNLHNVKPYIPGKPIEEVERELGIKNIIKMASNENPLGTSPGVLRAISDALGSINRYPDADCYYLKKAISEKYSVTSENVFVGNGSDEIFVLALRAFIHPGEEVLVADPTFLMYNIASVAEGAAVCSVPMKNMRYDLEAMAQAITDKTKMIFIANPDNPVGSYVTEDELDKFIDRVPEKVLIILDEAYCEFVDADDYPQAIGLADRSDKNIIITRTFSKAYGLAGLRVGYGIARRDIVEILNKVREPFNVNSIAQVAALAALKDDNHVKKSVSLVWEEKKRFYKFFKELNLEYVPSYTNFILVNTNRNSKKIFREILKRGIIIREMSAWRLDGFIRVTIG